MTNDDILDRVATVEGGFVDDPDDMGGPTNHGITLKTYSEYLGRDATVDELKALTKDGARSIYRKMYIADPGFERIENMQLRWLLVDTGVNNGRARATRWLQEIVGATPDGKLGLVTATRVNIGDQKRLFNMFLKRRFRAYAELVRAKHSQAVFIVGWINRACNFIGEAP